MLDYSAENKIFLKNSIWSPLNTIWSLLWSIPNVFNLVSSWQSLPHSVVHLNCIFIMVSQITSYLSQEVLIKKISFPIFLSTNSRDISRPKFNHDLSEKFYPVFPIWKKLHSLLHFTINLHLFLFTNVIPLIELIFKIWIISALQKPIWM